MGHGLPAELVAVPVDVNVEERVENEVEDEVRDEMEEIVEDEVEVIGLLELDVVLEEVILCVDELGGKVELVLIVCEALLVTVENELEGDELVVTLEEDFEDTLDDEVEVAEVDVGGARVLDDEGA